MPLAATVYELGAVAVQPVAIALGVEAEVVIMYPVTATLSVAVNDVTGIVRDEEGDVTENEFTTGAIVSIGSLEYAAYIDIAYCADPSIDPNDEGYDPNV